FSSGERTVDHGGAGTDDEDRRRGDDQQSRKGEPAPSRGEWCHARCRLRTFVVGCFLGRWLGGLGDACGRTFTGGLCDLSVEEVRELLGKRGCRYGRQNF